MCDERVEAKRHRVEVILCDFCVVLIVLSLLFQKQKVLAFLFFSCYNMIIPQEINFVKRKEIVIYRKGGENNGCSKNKP